jgi:hypothetical protein
MLNTLARPGRASAGHAPAELCTALAAFGDAVALVDPAARVVRWTSPAWQRLLPALGAGATLAALEAALPGLDAARWNDADPDAPQRFALGEAQQWAAELAALPTGHLALRLTRWRRRSRTS